MWTRRLEAIVDPTVAVAGAAILCIVLLYHLSDREAEVGSEALCWTLLPILLTRLGSKQFIPLGTFNETAPSSFSLWIVAAGIAAVSCYAAEIGIIYLLPLLTPLILVAEKRLSPESRDSRTPSSHFKALPFLAHTFWGATLVALIAAFALSDGNLKQSALSLLPLAALSVVYVAFIPRTAGGALNRFLPRVDIDKAAVPLSWRVVLMSVLALAAQTVAFGLPSIDIVPTLVLLGLVKALSWYFTIQIARHTSWCATTPIVIFGIVASRNPFIQLTEIAAVSPVIASFFVLGQIIYMLPEQKQSKFGLWVLVFVSLGPYLANLGAIRVVRSSVLPGSDNSPEHPAEALIRDARANFERLLQRQSTTYDAAEQEYRRRYRAEPPPGFKAWYEYAVANQSPIIDDFDMIYEAVSPFWKFNGKEFNRIVQNAANTAGIDLWLCKFNGTTAETHCHHPKRKFDRHFGDLFKKLLGDMPGALPDAQFLVNHLDEPRVLIPPPSADWGTEIKVTNLSERPTWDAITKFCSSQPGNTKRDEFPTVETYGLPFVTNRSSSLDLCSHPEYSTMHGLFLSPASFRLITGPVPVLSSGAPSTMSDLLYPSPAYYTERQFLPVPSDDIPWNEKQNNLYWTGSNTGGVSHTTSPHWSHFHRQRFVHLAQNLSPQPALHAYLRADHTSNPNPNKITKSLTSFLNARLYAVHFTRIFQCSHSPHLCRAQRVHFRLRPWTAASTLLKSKLVFDTDGNGISGRFYKLLASSSAVLKQTVLREWHDERLVPWVHYVPVSMDMGELPELVRWLLESEGGQKRAREIGEQGSEWFERAMRVVDARIYVWRLMLEVARLGEEGREGGLPGQGEGT